MSENRETGVAKTFRENQKYLRQIKGWSQSELARRMRNAGWEKYSQVAVSRTEDGERPVKLDEAMAIAALLDTTISQMTVPSNSVANLLERLKDQSRVMVEASRNLVQAARTFEDAREESQLLARSSKGIKDHRRATHSMVSAIEKEAESLEELSSMGIFTLLDWVEDKEYKMMMGDE